jgi:hypothetical protein
MDMLTLLLLLQSATAQPPPPPPVAQQFCISTNAKFESAPVDEDYRVIGVAPKTGVVYSGTLSVKFSRGRYVLVRKAAGATITGEARAVLCGADKVPLLQVRYDTKPTATKFFYTLSVNYDNYSVASCGPNSNRSQTAVGLEAWFPAPGDAH